MPLVLATILLLLLDAPLHAVEDAASAVDFNRDVRPILSDRCFACHGPDAAQRQAELRLDQKDGLFKQLDGGAVVVAGQPAESEIYRRISSNDANVQMPPPDSGKALSPKQVEIIKSWIEQGAAWQGHWAYVAPRKSEPPRVDESAHAGFVQNDIDRYLLARMLEQGLRPSTVADKVTLIRRLSFDLIGLPPTPAEVAEFLRDASDEAYEKLVDRLLASPHYGERMAMFWLDLVRYADTNGIHGDNHRDHALYRDYVIDAFNQNLPFDRFTREQLAGDLLPQPTTRQKIASGYNRLNMTTQEGGAQPKEYMAKYAADRVRNASVVWMGATLGCAECHDHKFDPFTTRQFYEFAAFFADVQEVAVGEQPPVRLPTAEQEARYDEVASELAKARAEFAALRPELADAQARWERESLAAIEAGKLAWQAVKPQETTSAGGVQFEPLDDGSILTKGENPAKDTYTVILPARGVETTGLLLEALTHDTLSAGGLSRANGNFVLTEVEVELHATGKVGDAAVPSVPVKLVAAVADHEQQGFPIAAAIDGKADTGWAVEGHVKKENRKAAFTFEKPIAAGPKARLVVRLKHDSIYDGHNIGRFRLSLTAAEKPSLDGGGFSADVVAALRAAPAERTADQQRLLSEQFRGIASELAPLRERIAKLDAERTALEQQFLPILIAQSGEPREMRVLPRGNWLDDSGPVVRAGAPEFVKALSSGERRASRLDLADWLVAADNPLTARVMVNRLWKLAFGRGIVTTLDDFGSQGAWPTHPDLLDWLAIDFVDSGWNVKRAMKQLVMSGAYRQSSLAAAEQREHDPFNKWLARQARFRLDAELVRDNALAASGLLVDKVGGVSVKPYQPAKYWSHLNFPVREWQHDGGEAQYRRGLYTYWCRTFLHPSLLAFDAPTREECAVERPRSNTPLQALVLLNDPTYVEAARVLAERVLATDDAALAAVIEPFLTADAAAEPPRSKSSDRIHLLFATALSRAARPAELAVLEPLLADHLQQYRADPEAAKQLLIVGLKPRDERVDAAELAAWTSLARVVLNLHETITRP